MSASDTAGVGRVIPVAPGGVGNRQVSVIAVHEHLAPILLRCDDLDELPVLGSPGWAELAAADDPAWRTAVVLAGYRWAARAYLEQSTLDEFAAGLSASYDWAAIAREKRSRAAWLAAHPWAKRVSA